MKIITLSKEEFENYSNKHKYNSYYQSTNYADYMEKNDGFNIHYLGFTDNSNHLIGASLVLYKNLFWGYKWAYAPRGFLFDYDDLNMVTELVQNLKRLLRKQKFIFITIDPPVVASERDKTGKIVQFNDNVNNILSNFKKNNFEHLGFNLYDESKLSRWNVIAKLNMDSRIMFNNFDNEIRDKINYSNSMAISVKVDEQCDINKFFDIIKKSNGKKTKRSFENLKNAFINDDKIKIFYCTLDTQKYTRNANRLYEKEEEKNNVLAEMIKSGDSIKYNIPKVVNDKVISDKLLHTYKKDIVASTKLLKSNPDGIICGVALTIADANGVNIVINYSTPEYEKYNPEAMLTYEIMKYYGSKNYKYVNIGAVTGNFDTNSKYYPLLLSKLGFNSSIIEYIGEFNIILNSFMYKIYKKKYKK